MKHDTFALMVAHYGQAMLYRTQDAGRVEREVVAAYDRLNTENERLRADLREWQEAAMKSYGERCGTDEQHCTCVPLLRVEIERLRAENEVYLARITKLNGELYDAHNVIDTYKNDPTKALREIGYHDVEGFYSMEGKDEPE